VDLKEEGKDLEVAGHNQAADKKLADLNVAIIHYWMMTWRGGEKVVESILKIFPNADVYTLFYDEQVCGPYLKGRKVYTSRLNLPILKKQYQKLFPLYPFAVKSLRLQKKYDLIISSESGPAKGIFNPDKIPHLCYIHSPMRYCWGYTDIYLESLPVWARKIARWRFNKLRQWDESTIDNVDLYVANSQNVKNRVQKYYGRESEVCFPPIDLELFKSEPGKEDKDYYLSFGALTPYKNIELLIDTFNQLDKKLVVIGSGSEKNKLESISKNNIEFKGSLPLPEVIKYIQQAKALLFPGEEDFGMIPLEVMSQGVPVIALKKGGALETVVENPEKPEQSSGIFFELPNTGSLLTAIEKFEALEGQFDPHWIRQHARKFGEDFFLKRFKQLVQEVI